MPPRRYAAPRLCPVEIKMGKDGLGPNVLCPKKPS